MTNYENDHLNPPNEREVKTCDCEDCSGTGRVEADVIINDDNETNTVNVSCSRCNGLGYLEY